MRSRVTSCISALLFLGTVFSMGTVTAPAAVPSLVNYQGILTSSGGMPQVGTFSVTFAIYPVPAGGIVIWSEVQSVTTNAAGLFNVLLGGVTPITDAVFSGPDRYLSIAVSPDAEMTPRTQITSVGYSHRVGTVDSAAGGTITTKVSIGPGHSNSGTDAFIAGQNNATGGDFASVSGGVDNSALADYATVGGGGHNYARGLYSTVGGGGGANVFDSNSASGEASTIGGGTVNQASNEATTVAGGNGNTASGLGATVGGGSSNRAMAGVSTIAGGWLNQARGDYSFVGGGANNHAVGSFSVVAGGGSVAASDSNLADGEYAAIGGGQGNRSDGDAAVIAGGLHNTTLSNNATVGGGLSNTAGTDPFATGGMTIAGGVSNAAGGSYSAIGGGHENSSTGLYATVPGGYFNQALGDGSFAAGSRAMAGYDGSFVWSDQSIGPWFAASTAPNQFVAKSSGGFYLFTDATLGSGIQAGPGDGSWSSLSDRNVKENIIRIDSYVLLEKLSRIPISEWNYTSQDESIRHIGPMAQDFHAAFGLGTDDKHISTVDADGVALAAIQALNEKLNEQLIQQATENVELRSQIAELRVMIRAQANDQK